MAIPAITPYSMPIGSQLPANRVDWRPEPARAALLIHDMQRYFVRPFVRGKSPLNELLANIGLLREESARLAMPVLYTAQPGGMSDAERGLLADFWGPGMQADPQHREIVAELAPAENDAVLTKWRYSAFHRTDLAEVLRARGRDQLLICGVYAHIGCVMTACEAFTLDIEPFLVADAVADLSADEHYMALDYAARSCAAVVSARTTVQSLRAHGATALAT